MSQLPLKIVPRLAYSAENFVAHRGVADTVERLSAFVQRSGFRIGLVHGAVRSGKTHLSILLAQRFTEAGYFPRIVEGADFFAWMGDRSTTYGADPGEIVIVDDADRYFLSPDAQESGVFVNLIELLRRSERAILFLTAVTPELFPCDDHVMSRVRAAQFFEVRPPDADDISSLVRAMAAQRGISLTEHQGAFLAKRLRHDIAEIERYLERAAQLADITGKSFKLPILSDAVNG